MMGNVLDRTIAAHGGWDRWREIRRLAARARIGGGLWPSRGKAGVLDDVLVTIDTGQQHVEYAPFGAPGRHSVWEPGRTAVVADDGRVLDSREDTQASFAGQTRDTPWDDHQLIHFSGYAMWTYLTTPFLFRRPGFEVEEIGPWQEDGEEWQRLKVLFPADIASHSREQVFYFDRGGLLRRHDYVAELIGGLPAANYASDHRPFAGLVLPTRRLVYARGPDNLPLTDRLAVSIDIDDVTAS
jgi:hypothetical protein